MAAFSRLMVATLSEVERYDRVRLSQGLIKSDFLPGPFARVTPRTSPSLLAQATRQLPTIHTLPKEVMSMVLGQLEPIWLFQLETAYPQIRALSMTLNHVWYEIMPSALFAVPEHFQDEEHVATGAREQYSGSLQLITSDNRPPPMRNYYSWNQSGSEMSMVVLPMVEKMSELSVQAGWYCGLQHPTNPHCSPLVPAQDGTFRIRNQALGGPFQPEIDYRRELAAWLHDGRRCQICFEPTHLDCRLSQTAFGVLFCRTCHGKYMLTSAQLDAIPGLAKLVQRSKNLEWFHHRVESGLDQWRPMVDDVLRKQLGIDFETALAKQQYLTHLCATLTAFRCSTETNRTKLRNQIVEEAKLIWDSGIGIVHVNEEINYARSTYAPTEILQRFLFPPRSLDGSLLTVPFDDSESWLEDPTKALVSKDMATLTRTWKHEAARDMVIKLCDWPSYEYYDVGHGGRVTTWINAADEYHVQRMLRIHTADFAIQELKGLGPTSYPTPTSSTTQGQLFSREIRLERLGVILAKLKIPPMSPVRKEVLVDGVKVVQEVLNERELKVAKDVYFKKLLQCRFTGCPTAGILTFPPGLLGYIEHFRRCRCHPDINWNSETWL